MSDARATSGGSTVGWVAVVAPGGSGAVHVVVTGLPDGDGSWQVRVDDGVVAEVSAGAPTDADLTLTFPAALASEVASGALDRQRRVHAGAHEDRR